jgi:NAD(P)-dependent dehydrogenase (short-subunit alcohol dehydrogenase family)
MDLLPGRAAVITGAASGLGLAMAQRFATEGMHLVVADIDEQRLTAAAAALRSHGTTVTAVRTDVSSADDVRRLADVAFEQHGEVAVLCNNAGVTKRARSWELTYDDWRWVLSVDLWSVVHGVHEFVPRLLAQGTAAHVVNTASLTGLLPLMDVAAYAVAKTGVVALSECLALELADEGAAVGVSVLAPGYVATNIAANSRDGAARLPATAPSNRPRSTTTIEARMTAADVADEVLDAVRTDRFWILTHQDYRPIIVERAEGIGGPGQPVGFPVR